MSDRRAFVLLSITAWALALVVVVVLVYQRLNPSPHIPYFHHAPPARVCV